MKKILIFTYYYPPCQGIPSWRLKSLVDSLEKNGFDIDVITRQWTGKENQWADYLKDGTQKTYTKKQGRSTIHYIKHHQKELKFSSSTKVNFAIDLIRGNFQREQDHNKEFYDYAKPLLTQHKYDLIIGSSFPLSINKLVYQIGTKEKIPYILDFRDTWDNELLNKNKNINIKRKVENYFRELHIKKWIKNALFYTTISPTFVRFFNKKLNVNNGTPVFNGFEESIFSTFSKNDKLNLNKFTISIIGTLYPKQDIDLMINGFSDFLNKVDYKKVQINFIGVSSIKSVSDKIKKLNNEAIKITDRVPRQEALKYMENSHLLFYIGWKGYNGIYSGKIFEYLGSKRNILIAPNDHNVLEALISETKAGYIADSKEEMSQKLIELYTIWTNKNFLPYYGLDEKIKFYSREEQFETLIKKINHHNE